jgi:hypothetical protein
MRFDRELVKGTTETVLLAVLSEEPLHGYELARRLRARTDGVFELGEGTLYSLPARPMTPDAIPDRRRPERDAWRPTMPRWRHRWRSWAVN